VLVDLGANWCVWCHRLHHTLQTDAAVARALNDNFVLVLVDVNHRDGKKRNDAVNGRYGNPIKEGLPVLVVLDADGHQLLTQESGALEDGKDAHDPAKIIAFLQKWAPKAVIQSEASRTLSATVAPRRHQGADLRFCRLLMERFTAPASLPAAPSRPASPRP
jgi:glutaredoxin